MASSFSSILQNLRIFNSEKNISQSISVDLLLNYGLIQGYSYVKHNKLVSREYTDSGITMDSYYIHTYEDTRDGNVTTNRGHLFQITLPESVFEYTITLRPDVQDSFRHQLQEYIRIPVVVIVGIAYMRGPLVSFINPLARRLFVNSGFIIILGFSLFIAGYIRRAKKDIYNKYIRFENGEFEKYFDVSCYKKLHAREFLNPKRLEVITKRIEILAHSNEAGHSIAFSQNKIYIYISYLEPKGTIKPCTPLGEVFAHDSGTVKYLIEQLHIESLFSK